MKLVDLESKKPDKMSDQGEVPVSPKKKGDKSDSTAKGDKVDIGKGAEVKADVDDPKPRIVLTFRSDKTGAKSSNMKLVSTEEKHDISPRRRTRNAKYESEDEDSPKKDKSVSQSENDEASDSSHTAQKRSTHRKSKESSDNVLANAIARKEKCNESATVSGTQRPSRKIKPTAKILANKELEIAQKVTLEEGVRTRRQRRKSFEILTVEEPVKKQVKRVQEDRQSENLEKLSHLNELGLQSINIDSQDTVDSISEENEDEKMDSEAFEDTMEENDTDDDPEVIEMLIYDDDDDDEDFTPRVQPQRRSKRFNKSSRSPELAVESADVLVEETKRSGRKRTGKSQKDFEVYQDNNMEQEESKQSELDPETEPCEGVSGEDSQEAACPDGENRILGACQCSDSTSYYAADEDLTEPVFCQAIELVDEMRVGCSHRARKEGAQYAALVRAGPRAPYVLACGLHRAQLARHMCCPTCGIFCTQGSFYQCSKKHLFHLECGLTYNGLKTPPGCPHCGVYSYRWSPVNRQCWKVKVKMTCSNKRVYLPEQRVQCKQAYLGFSTLPKPPVDTGPVIPKDLLPISEVDLKKLCEKTDDEEEILANDAEERLCAAIVAGEGVDTLVNKIISGMDLNKPLPNLSDGTYMHCAARSGNLAALYLLQYSGSNLDVADANSKTPLMVAILALIDLKSDKKPDESAKESEPKEMEVDEVETVEKEDACQVEGKTEESTVKSETEIITEEKLMRVVKYLVAAGCDLNIAGPDGMTALHMAATNGHEEICQVLLESGCANVEAKDNDGWTSLVWAAENNHRDVVRLLLSHGADPMSVDNEGNAVLHWCCATGAAAAAQAVLDRCPQALQQLNGNTDTALHVAARQEHYPCVVILLARGARTDAENSAGELPVEVCSGECQKVIALHMQMSLTVREGSTCRLLDSDISKGREPFPIPCVNEVDEESLPRDFTYVTNNVPRKILPVDNTIDTMQGCTCTGNCTDSSCACSILGVKQWWNNGVLVKGFPYDEPPMLFQCNQTCKCNVRQCGNSVVSRLAQTGAVFVRAQVFRTDACGWGLRARQPVRRGAPVAVYCGELLAMEDADLRSEDRYMFALDVKPDLLEQCVDKTVMCIDAARYGSAARFINHSCRPNLAPVRVLTQARDLRLPTVTLFATSDIRENDQLTFDYGDKFWSVKSKWMKCECGEVDCRYPTKSTEETE